MAAVLTEPALTNMGVVLPESGFHEGLRQLTRHGTLLILDEAHTQTAAWGGLTRTWTLEPDIVTLGKTLGLSGNWLCLTFGMLLVILEFNRRPVCGRVLAGGFVVVGVRRAGVERVGRCWCRPR